jgi:hypothetical protein
MNAQEDRQELERLAPFYVTGKLPPRSVVSRAAFERAMAEDPGLARNVATARAERDEVLALNEALPAPGAGASEKFFAMLDAEPPRSPGVWARLDVGARLADFFSPRALGWVATAACLLVAVEAGFLVKPATGPTYVTASREDAPQEGRFALIAFAPDAAAGKIAELLAANAARIVDGPRAGGFFRVKLGDADMSEAQAAEKLEALKASGLVRFAQKTGG